MLSAKKLNKLCKERQVGTGQLADNLSRAGLDKKKAISAVRNWKNGLMKPIPKKEDIQHLARGLSAEVSDISSWTSSYSYAPMSATKARLVSELIVGLPVQTALDTLKFTPKRAASMFEKVLKTAIADADENQADVENLYVSEARVDDAGWRIGTKRWIAKDRGRAHPIRKTACHMYVTVTEA